MANEQGLAQAVLSRAIFATRPKARTLPFCGEEEAAAMGIFFGFETRYGVMVAAAVGIVNQTEFWVTVVYDIITGAGITNFYWSVLILTIIYNFWACLSFREAALPTGFGRHSVTFAVFMAQNIGYQAYNDVSFNGLSARRVWIWLYFVFFIVNNVMFYQETQQKANDGEGAQMV